ncbi:hypothetical protein [Blautia massiliensis (ex Durand et al. 2017)]|jgi:hypothetical protein|uniref:hypothetical protein n=1 Tax=Blautia massiliensis (ex Durand et al. 2017) TaxID=1737424 RepID=UPI00156D5C4F|nr:hypothetical protein [Blautia massiliensis (ex Durand et al. 2017)]NSK75318.1 hypothetical protein [Blautia massiliensis (ex Durand et al. 2017)]
MYSKENLLKLKVINCKNYIYIADEDYYGVTDLTRYLFDGEVPEKTNKDRWFKLNSIPKVVAAKQEDKRINVRYELKAGYTATELMPQIITQEMEQSEEYDEVIGLYNYKYDTIPGEYEPIEFEIKEIYSRENFEFVPNKYNAKTDLLTQIEYPEEAYQDKPCKLDCDEMLKIIRNYVKANIDTNVADITSDYDFHFEVKKKIALADPYNILIDTNNNLFSKRKRKPKWVNRMISHKTETIIDFKNSTSTDFGKDCVKAPSIIGENYQDLQNKVEKFLTELMSQINKKYCECPTCKGWGIVEGE